MNRTLSSPVRRSHKRSVRKVILNDVDWSFSLRLSLIYLHSTESDNVQTDQKVTSDTGNDVVEGISSTQQTVRRSPVDTVVRTPNDVQPERTRIPSTWITSSTKATTQRTTSTTRVPLRTLPPTARTSTQFREPAPVTARPVSFYICYLTAMTFWANQSLINDHA